MRTWLAIFIVAASVSITAQTAPASAPAPAPGGQPPAPNQAPAPADQAPAPPVPTFRAGVDVITVDVSAVDASGKPVSDLRVPDFVVKIDGQPRRVVSVEAVKFDADAIKRQLAADPFESFFTTNQSAPNSRLIVLAVDQLNIQPGNVRILLQTAARFLDNLSPLDRVAFYAYPDPGIAIDFTTDHPRIKRAMETVVGSAQRFETKFNIGLYEAIQSILKDDELTQQRVFTRECRRLVAQALEECIRQVMSEMALMVNRVREDRHRSVDALEQLLNSLALINAPKSLIMMSEGLILDDPSDVDGIVRAASRAQASINVLMMDVLRGSDIARGAVMPPTMSEDRDLQTNGLRELASASRGTLFNIYGNGQPIFDRLVSELSQYYLIGVEKEAQDSDTKPHRIDVEVRRRGVSLRSRRAFVLAAPRPATVNQRLNDLLRAPFGVTEVPLRVTTYALQDAKSSKVRILVAADVDQAGSQPSPYTVGWLLIDRDGRVAASAGERGTLTPLRVGSSGALEFRTEALVEPGIYSLRLAVIDQAGRRGGIVREVNAWRMAGEEFAVADLVVGAPPETGQTLIFSVEPRIDSDIAAVVELYTSNVASFDQTQVIFEIAGGPDSPALVSAPGTLLENDKPGSRSAQALDPGARAAARSLRRTGPDRTWWYRSGSLGAAVRARTFESHRGVGPYGGPRPEPHYLNTALRSRANAGACARGGFPDHGREAIAESQSGGDRGEGGTVRRRIARSARRGRSGSGGILQGTRPVHQRDNTSRRLRSSTSPPDLVVNSFQRRSS